MSRPAIKPLIGHDLDAYAELKRTSHSSYQAFADRTNPAAARTVAMRKHVGAEKDAAKTLARLRVNIASLIELAPPTPGEVEKLVYAVCAAVRFAQGRTDRRVREAVNAFFADYKSTRKLGA